jgi:hypothetical protein
MGLENRKIMAAGKILPLSCADCGGMDWELELIHHPDGRTLLRFRCGDPDCIANKRMLLGLSENEIIYHDELDITGQGYDPEDTDKSRVEDTGSGWN